MALLHEDRAFLPTGSHLLPRQRAESTDSVPQPVFGNQNRFDVDDTISRDSITKETRRLNRHDERHNQARCFPCFGSRRDDTELRTKRILPRFFWWIIAAVVLMMIGLALALGLVFGLRRAHATNTSLTVDLGYSKYVGYNGDNGVDQWWGIRYAAPPVGDLRWAAPADPVVDGKTHDANQVCSPYSSSRIS
jgi:hypothetical protein